MVVDTLENLENTASLNPLFAQAIEFLKSHDLHAMEVGKTELNGKDLVINIAQTTPKTKEQAKLETHNEFIDIQVPLSGTEIMGYTPGKIVCRLMLPIVPRKILLSLKGWPKHTLLSNRVCLPSSFRRTDMLRVSVPTV